MSSNRRQQYHHLRRRHGARYLRLRRIDLGTDGVDRIEHGERGFEFGDVGPPDRGGRERSRSTVAVDSHVEAPSARSTIRITNSHYNRLSAA